MPPGKRRGRQITHDVFASVIRAFLISPKFEKLGAGTQVNYRHLLKLAEEPEGLGSVPVEEMRPALVQAFLDGLADKPGAQLNARTVLKTLEKWAIVRDLLPGPITMGTETVYDDDAGHIPWTDEQVAYAEAHTAPDLSRAITLAANTGQRGSDLVKMRWTDIEAVEGHVGINVRQKKTDLKIWVPFTKALILAAAGWERRPGFILLNGGEPWTRYNLTNRWAYVRGTQDDMKAFAGLVLHGLRGTAVVRLRRAGATTAQICDMVGMSPRMVKRYSRYSDQKENALAAVYKLDGTPVEQTRARRWNAKD